MEFNPHLPPRDRNRSTKSSGNGEYDRCDGKKGKTTKRKGEITFGRSCADKNSLPYT